MPCRSIVLVSASPRRSDLLRLAGLTFTVRPVEVDETPRPGESAGFLAERLARAKVQALTKAPSPALAVAADTVVSAAGALLGKPRHRADPRRMLRLLARRTPQGPTPVARRPP